MAKSCQLVILGKDMKLFQPGEAGLTSAAPGGLGAGAQIQHVRCVPPPTPTHAGIQAVQGSPWSDPQCLVPAAAETLGL